MGSTTSRPPLVDPTQHEVPAYVQRDTYDHWCGIFGRPSNPGIGPLQEPARFNEPKPYELYGVSDDHWAALKLRVDPLARRILDPHRSVACASFLCLLLCAVFAVVKPGVDGVHYQDGYYADDDDDYYYYAQHNDVYAPYVEDDAVDSRDSTVTAEYDYKRAEVEYRLRFWYAGLALVVTALAAVTANLAAGMYRRNTEYDERIREVCEEMGPRFATEGFAVEYRTNQEAGHTGTCLPRYVLRPVRVIVFRRVGDEMIHHREEGGSSSSPSPSHHRHTRSPQSSRGGPTGKAAFGEAGPAETQQSPPPSSFQAGGHSPPQQQQQHHSPSHSPPGGGDDSDDEATAESFGTIVVRVPHGSGPGRVVAITTPGGGQVHASVPEGASEGENFTVQVPRWMIRGARGTTPPQKSLS